MGTTGIITVIIIGVVIIWAVTVYNRLVHLRNVRKNAFANVDVILRKRYDLVPQLVATVKGYAAHEKTVLENVIKARSAGLGASGDNEKIKAAENMHRELIRLCALSENYPDLKADRNFMHLQESLCEIEEDLVNVRSFFNMSTREYNDQVLSFPALIIAGRFGFREEPMLEEQADMREELMKHPQIQF